MYTVHAQNGYRRRHSEERSSMMGTVSNAEKYDRHCGPRLAVSSPLPQKSRKLAGIISLGNVREIGSLSAMHSRCPAQGEHRRQSIIAQNRDRLQRVRERAAAPAHRAGELLQFQAAKSAATRLRSQPIAASALPASPRSCMLDVIGADLARSKSVVVFAVISR